MLNQDEELWEKVLPYETEALLGHEQSELAKGRMSFQMRNMQTPDAYLPKPLPRDKTRVVTYRVPHNAAVQIYNYKDRKGR